MNEATMAATAVALVAPYLVEGAKELAKKVGEEAGGRVVKLWDVLRGRLAGKDALADVEAEPGDQRRWAALEVQLEKALKEDPGFRSKLARLIEAIPAEQRTAIRQIAKIRGDDNILGQFTGSGNQMNVGPRS